MALSGCVGQSLRSRGIGAQAPHGAPAPPMGGGQEATSNALSCRAQVLCLAPPQTSQTQPLPVGVNRGPCGGGEVPVDPAD